jgi:2-haloacid dehalogenase
MPVTSVASLMLHTGVNMRGGGNIIRAVAFDAYGTIFDVHSVVAVADRIFPGMVG